MAENFFEKLDFYLLLGFFWIIFRVVRHAAVAEGAATQIEFGISQSAIWWHVLVIRLAGWCIGDSVAARPQAGGSGEVRKRLFFAACAAEKIFRNSSGFICFSNFFVL